MTRFSVLLVLATFVSWSAVGLAEEESYGPFKMARTSIGQILTTAEGMTLYTFDQDPAGMSNCTAECATYWLPAVAPADAQPVDDDLTIVGRADGTPQWAMEGKPLYTYVNDKKPGDVTGDGKNGLWHVVRED